MQDWAESFYKSKAWQRCQAAYVKRRGGLCERCAEKGLIVPGEIVHHKIILTPENIHNPEISLNEKTLCLLCRNCHALMHKPKKRYKVDEFGRIMALE